MQEHYRTRGEARPRHEPAPAGDDCSGHVDGTPARLFLCQRCRVQVLICRHCDRGHLYCTAGCSQAARRGSQRDAGRRYQPHRRSKLDPYLPFIHETLAKFPTLAASRAW